MKSVRSFRMVQRAVKGGSRTLATCFEACSRYVIHRYHEAGYVRPCGCYANTSAVVHSFHWNAQQLCTYRQLLSHSSLDSQCWQSSTLFFQGFQGYCTILHADIAWLHCLLSPRWRHCPQISHSSEPLNTCQMPLWLSMLLPFSTDCFTVEWSYNVL